MLLKLASVVYREKDGKKNAVGNVEDFVIGLSLSVKDLLTFFLAGHLLIRIPWRCFASILWLNSLLIDLWRVLFDPQFLASPRCRIGYGFGVTGFENTEPCWTHDTEHWHRMRFTWCYLRSSCWLVVMAALRRVLMRTALPLAEAFLDCRTVVRVSVILSLICVCIRIVRGYGAMHETPVTSQ